MGLLSIVLLVIFAIASLLMILVIMLQDDQGEGIGGLFGGGSSSAFGSRSGNILTRFTTVLGAIFIVGAFALAWLNRTPESTDILEQARLEQLQAADESNWWVERIEEPAPVMEQLDSPETKAESEEESDVPLGINR
jgi:preprotein translocase subunit SecG